MFSDVGSINRVATDSSSLCEMVSDLVAEVNKDLFDAQISTALLTGMVAETDRFGNEKARPHTMSVSGILMSAGASTQLISSKLLEPEPDICRAPADISHSRKQVTIIRDGLMMMRRLSVLHFKSARFGVENQLVRFIARDAAQQERFVEELHQSAHDAKTRLVGDAHLEFCFAFQIGLQIFEQRAAAR